MDKFGGGSNFEFYKPTVLEEGPETKTKGHETKNHEDEVDVYDKRRTRQNDTIQVKVL